MPQQGASSSVVAAAAIHRPQPSLTGAKAAARMAAAAKALELAPLGHRPVQRRARQDRALTLTFIGLAPWSKRNQGHPAQLHGVAATLSHSARWWEHYRLVWFQKSSSVEAYSGHV